jgi:hypothetical protein
MLRIPKYKKAQFFNDHKDMDKKEFVKLAREHFGYSPTTIAYDIYESFRRCSEKSGWGSRAKDVYK